MNKTQKRTMISLSSLFLCLVSTLAVATYAWFGSLRKSDVGAKVDIKNVNLVESVKYHAYHKLDTPTEGVYTFEKTTTDNLIMGNYSLLNSGYQVLMEITLTAEGSTSNALTLNAFSSATYFLGDLVDGTLVHPLQKTGNSFSSIINFFAFAETSITDQTDYLSLNISNRQIDSVTGKEKFIDTEYNLHTEVDVCSFSVPMNKIYIMLDYDKELIEHIYSLNLGNPVLSDISDIDPDGNSYISYSTDFGFVLMGLNI